MRFSDAAVGVVTPYSPEGVVYTAAIQPGLVIVMEHLSLSGYNPTATLTLAQYAEHAPCRLDKFEFKRHTRVDLTLGPVGPTQVDVHQARGKMTLRGSHRRGGPLGLDVFIEEKVNGRECEAGFNPTLVKGDYGGVVGEAVEGFHDGGFVFAVQTGSNLI